MTNITPLDFDPNRRERDPDRRDRERDDRRPHLRGVPDERDERYQGIGTEFAAARLQTGMDVGQVATALRIRKEHLAAIEEGRFADLPAPAYALGFVRSYADYLGLDAAAAVEAFKQETSTSRRRTPLVFPTAEPMDRMPRGWLLGLSAVLAAVVFGAWYYSERAGQIFVERVPVPGTESVTRAPAAPAVPTPAVTEVRAAPQAKAPDVAPPTPAANDAAIARVLGALPAAAVTAAPTPAPPPAPAPAVAVAGPPAAVPPAPAAVAPVPAAPQPAVAAAPPAVTPVPTAEPARPEPEAAAADEPEEPAGASEPQVVLDEVITPVPQVAAPAEPLVTTPAIIAPAALPTTVAAAAPATVAIAVPPPPVATAVPPAALGAVPPAIPADVAALTPGGQVFGEAAGRVVVVAKQDSWVQVTGAAGELLLTRILRAGDKYIAPQREDLMMMTGNAGALEVLVDGNALPPIGPIGTVRRNVSLSPKKLLNGTAVQQ